MNIEKARANKKSKKRNRLIFRTIILGILLVAVVYALVTNLTKNQTNVDVGDNISDDKLNFTLEQMNKNNPLDRIELADLKGKGIMLNFWATYCEPCEYEMPFMQKLYPEYKKKGVEIVTVNLDSTELVVHRFIDKYDLTFPVLQDKKNVVMDQYSIGPIPSTFFINPEGEVVKIVEGALTLDRLEEYLKQIQPK